MLILMSHQATRDSGERHPPRAGARVPPPSSSPGTDRLAIGVLGSNPGQIRDAVVALPGVIAAVQVSKPYKQVGREWHPTPTVVTVGGVRIGEGAPLAVAGGPAPSSRGLQLMETARPGHARRRGLGAPGQHLQAADPAGLPGGWGRRAWGPWSRRRGL